MNIAKLTRSSLLAFIVATSIIAFAASAQVASAAGAPASAGDFSAPQELGPSCRYGVAALGQGQLAWMDDLNAGWFVTFGPNGDSSGQPEFVPIVRVKQNKQGCAYLPGYKADPPLTPQGLGAAVLSRPGHLWIVGNEPDRGPNPESCTQGVQDDTHPDVYARAYHDIYYYIKNIDPTARVANAGLVQVTPGRLQYLDKVWDAYQRFYGGNWPVDVWNMHLYVLPEVDPAGKPNGIAGVAVGTDPALGIRESGNDKNKCADPNVYCWAEHDNMTEFTKQVRAMRTWMKDRGQQQKPLMLSEYSILYPYEVDSPGSCFLQDEYGNCFTPERVRTFLNNSMSYLETAADPNLGYARDGNRLVQRWLWFSIANTGVGQASNLLNPSGTALTLPGGAYSTRAAAAARYINLFPASTSGTALPAVGGVSKVVLRAEVRNVGANETSGKTTVTFYADAALTQPIGSSILIDRLRGCEANGVPASVVWPGRTPGWWDYWVVVDSPNFWEESNELDNVLKGRVFVGSGWTYLPVMTR
ncbi:MAG: hypothetical protein MUC34_01735 [Anaerolineae bacterium]|nr:hypothetical protein [Anaerolineae bacterium]